MWEHCYTVGALILKICEFQILSGKIQLNFDSALKLKLLQVKFLLSNTLPTFLWWLYLSTGNCRFSERKRERIDSNPTPFCTWEENPESLNEDLPNTLLFFKKLIGSYMNCCNVHFNSCSNDIYFRLKHLQNSLDPRT